MTPDPNCPRCGGSGAVHLPEEWTGTRTSSACDIPCPTCMGRTLTNGQFIPHDTKVTP